MKPKSISLRHILMGIAALSFTFLLASWGFRQNDTPHSKNAPHLKSDTIPERKARNLDEAIAELDRLDWQKEMANAMKEVEVAMKEFDADKIKLQIEKAMKEVDMTKIKAEVDAAMKEVDFAKIQQEIKAAMDEVNMEEIEADVKKSLASIDWEEIQTEIKKAQDIDMKGIEKEMNRAAEEMKKIQPQLKKDLEKAKVEIEKAKATLKEYKSFVDGLESDGLINKKENYSIQHKDGKLIINGKEADQKTYNKYRSFLEKHKSLNIRQSDEDFDIDLD